MASWALILFEAFADEASNVSSDCSDAGRASPSNRALSYLVDWSRGVLESITHMREYGVHVHKSYIDWRATVP